MRAIILTGNSQLSRNPCDPWGILSPLVDRPFLQHVVEYIVGQGIREIDFVLPEIHEPVRAILGDGTRWGTRFGYYMTATEESFRAIAVKCTEEYLLLAHSDRLPPIQVDLKTSVPTLFCWRGEELHWTGWGIIRAADLLHLPKAIEQNQVFPFLSQQGGRTVFVEGKRPLSANSYEDLIESNRKVLGREFPGLLVGGREMQPGIWISRNVSVHPTAKLKPPAFLGENSKVGALVQVGPVASIGRHCVIERETFVSDSVVFSGSYVGENLTLKGVVVDRSRLINTRWDAEIEGVDELLLGSVEVPPVRIWIERLCSRLAAVVALLLAAPWLGVMAAGSALGWLPALRREMVVETPTVSAEYRWKYFPLWSFGERQAPEGTEGWLKHFVLQFLPALFSIASGHMGFAGSRPHTREEAVRNILSQSCAFLYLQTGLLQSGLSHNGYPESEQTRSAAATMRWSESLSLFLTYAQLVGGDLSSQLGRLGGAKQAE